MNRNNSATASFSLLAGIEAFVFSGGLSLLKSLLFAIIAGVAGGLIGRVMWLMVVNSSTRWSVPTRGALAGAFTGWLSIFPAATALFNLGRYSSLSGFAESLAPFNALLEFTVGIVAFGLLGTVGAGWITIPTAAFLGYVVGREQQRGDSSEAFETESQENSRD